MAKKQVPFYTECSKKAISLGNGELSRTGAFLYFKFVFPFFDEEPLENILCIQRRPVHAKPDFN